MVICSPAAAASQWVNREIELFRELHPQRPILLALVKGDPGSAFPPAILAGEADAEPLAADFADDGDGRRLGLLKLVAGLTAVPLADLVQRDAQRKMRRVMAVTVAAAVLALIMAAMAMIAIQNRNEAERQQAEAEDLVRFMITDLRDKLDDAGRLDLLSVANERALDYYRAQDLDTLDPASLALRAGVLHAIGEDLEQAGDLAGALDAFEEAAATTRAQLAGDPSNPELIFADAQSHFWVGFIAWRELRIGKATVAWERYRELTNQLVAIDPANGEWQMEAGYAASNLGTVLLRTKGRAGDALIQFESALATFQAMARQAPDDPQILLELSDAYAWVADCHRALADIPAARAGRAQQAEILQSLLRRDPVNAEYHRAMIGHGLGMGMIERDAGRPDRAVRLLRENYLLAAEQAATDPANVQLEKQRVTALIYLESLNPVAARQVVAGAACSQTNQMLDPEFALMCSIIKGVAIDSARGQQMVQRLGGNGLTPRMGLDPTVAY